MSDFIIPQEPITIEQAIQLHGPLMEAQDIEFRGLLKLEQQKLIKWINEELIRLAPQLKIASIPLAFLRRQSGTVEAREVVFRIFREKGINIEACYGGKYDGVHFCWLEGNYDRPEEKTIGQIMEKLWSK